MNRALWKKSFLEARWLLAGCTLTLFAFSWLRVWLVSQVDTSRFKQIIELLPGDWKRFSPVDFEWLITYEGRIALSFDEPLVVLCICIWAIARGSDCISGEIGRGTMEMLLAQPVSRREVLTSHSVVTFLGLLIITLACWAGIACGVATTQITEMVHPSLHIPLIEYDIPLLFLPAEEVKRPMSELVNSAVFLPAALNFFLLGLFFTSLSVLMSSWDRYRWRTIGIVVAIYIAFAILKITGMASDSLSWLQYFSIFAAYEPEVYVSYALRDPGSEWWLLAYDEAGQVIGLGPVAFYLILLVLSVATFVGGAIIFHKRDLPAPL